MLELLKKSKLFIVRWWSAKEFPENVDITLVEGALGTDEDIQKIKKIRENTRPGCIWRLCGNRPYSFHAESVWADATLKSLFEHESLNQQIPSEGVPALLPQALPLHQMVKVDLFVPGCPPSADTIFYTLSELIEGRVPDLTTLSRFGA
jgi:NAD-reducing hydrogenase small subunit